MICVVEDIRDVIAIENTRQFEGLYHVLGGVDRPHGRNRRTTCTPRALGAHRQWGVAEVVLALGPPWRRHHQLLSAGSCMSSISVSADRSRIGVGGDLDQVDEVTLGRSIADRKPYEQSVRR